MKRIVRFVLCPFTSLFGIFKKTALSFKKASLKKKVLSLSAFFAVCSLVLAVFTLLVNLEFVVGSRQYIYKKEDEVPSKPVVMILGARVRDHRKLSDMLSDRCQTAVELYKSGKASKILVSGDHGQKNYDEVNAIKDYLLSNGVKPEDIFLDHAGFDTYDSMYRARDIFQVKSLSISTQDFHLARSVYIARALGIDAVGVKADKQGYAILKNAESREIFARVKAYFDVLFHSKPKFLGEVIPITGDSSKSWDEDLKEFQR